jgi:hypothetical protein
MIFGFSGHQRLESQELWPWVQRQLESHLSLRRPSAVVSALAGGADQLFAGVALQLGIPLSAIVPCRGYESTFAHGDEAARYHEILALAAEVVRLEFNEPSEDAYLAAGQWIVAHCDLLIVVWNGRPAAGKGGTGDVVQCARATRRSILHINPSERTVTELR